jgi:DNA-binding MarR family transcriptional regulator
MGTSRGGANRSASSGSELEGLVLEILGAFFDLRAAGQEQGLVNAAGAGNWGLMRILREDGPRTVPEVARMRSVSRQYIQKLANELSEGGLIEMIENPAHKRSKRMRLTRKGEREFERLTGRLRAFLGGMAADFRPGELRSATRTIRALRSRLAPTTGRDPS